MNLPTPCSHGVSFNDDCPECTAISKDESLRLVSDLCHRAAVFYEKNPGLVQPATIVDLYRTVARLAAVVERKAAKENNRE
jgi:hypothetical protein